MTVEIIRNNNTRGLMFFESQESLEASAFHLSVTFLCVSFSASINTFSISTLAACFSSFVVGRLRCSWPSEDGLR
mgnify:CR=1 FL=1